MTTFLVMDCGGVHPIPLDLPTVGVDSSVIYKYAADDIGQMLGLTAAQIGTLLGPKGLNWAGNPRYQEIGRYRPGRQKFWHYDVPKVLEDMLKNPPPDRVGGLNPRIRVIVRNWRKKNGLPEIIPISGK